MGERPRSHSRRGGRQFIVDGRKRGSLRLVLGILRPPKVAVAEQGAGVSMGPSLHGAPRRGRLTAFLGAVIGALMVGSMAGCTDLPATSAPTTTVDTRVVPAHLESCVAALNAGDEAKLAALLNNPAQPDDARHRIEALGGRQWRIRLAHAARRVPWCRGRAHASRPGIRRHRRVA